MPWFPASIMRVLRLRNSSLIRGVFVLEVAVDRSGSHPSFFGYQGHGGIVEAAFTDQAQGGIQNGLVLIFDRGFVFELDHNFSV